MWTEPAEPPAPQGDYVPAVRHGDVIYSAGMTPRRGGQLVITGVVGDTVSLKVAYAAAELAAANAVAAIRLALAPGNGLKCVRMTVYVACVPGFTALSAVADGASAGLMATLGADALPARSAIGVMSLPSGAPVEVELTAVALDV